MGNLEGTCCENKLSAFDIGTENYPKAREYSFAWDSVLEIYSSLTIRAGLGVLLPTSDHKQYYPPRTNTPAMHELAKAASLKGQHFKRRGGYVCYLPNRYKGHMRYYCRPTVDEYT